MSRWLRVLVPLVAVAVALSAGTVAATKAINGKAIKNGSITEKKLSPKVRSKLNSPGPPGPPGPQGVPGSAAPAGRTAVAQSEAIGALALDTGATILALDSAKGTGLLNVDDPSRLLITAQVNAYKAATNFNKVARVACRLQHEDAAGLKAVGRRVEATMQKVDAGPVVVSVALVGSVDVDAGAHDVSIRCDSLASPPADAGVSFFSASVNVDGVPR